MERTRVALLDQIIFMDNKSWLQKNKKDAIILGVIFILAFIISLVINRSFGDALTQGIAFLFLAVIVINFYRYLKIWGKRLEIPKDKS